MYQPKWRDKNGTQTGKTWYVQYHLHGRVYRVPLRTRDKRVAEQKASEIFKRAERKAAGLIDPLTDEQARPLEQHVADFEAVLVSRGRSGAHLKDRMGCLREWVAETKATALRDLDAPRIARWLSSLTERGLAARTVNRRLQAVRQFARWCLSTRRLPYDPLASLRPLNEEADRRHVRRALSPEELERLYEAAATRPLAEAVVNRMNSGVTPRERVRLLALGSMRRLVYRLAAGTGLRRKELRLLRVQDVDLERREIAIPAAHAKSKRNQSVPLRSDLAEELAAFLPEDAAPGDPVFPTGAFPRRTTFQRDLVAAGLATVETADDGSEHTVTEDDAGLSLDFHCLRVAFVSNLVARGVHPRVVQALARHAKIDTTMRAYTSGCWT
jgi:integrase